MYIINEPDGPWSVLSTVLEINGEPNDSPWVIGGGAVVDVGCTYIARAGISFDNRANCHSPYSSEVAGRAGIVVRSTEEGPPPARRSQWGLYPDSVDFQFASNGGIENDGYFNMRVCLTGTNGILSVALSPTCRQLLYANPTYNGNGGIGFGSGFYPGGPQPLAPVHIKYDGTITGSDGLIIQNIASSGGQASLRWQSNAIDLMADGANASARYMYNITRGTQPFTLNLSNDQYTFSGYAGSGSGFLCVDPNGTMFRSPSACH